KQSRMRKSSGGAPALELQIGSGGVFGDEFDGGVGRGIAGLSGFYSREEHGGILRDAEKFAEREAAVRELAQKMLCCSRHRVPSVRAPGSERQSNNENIL